VPLCCSRRPATPHEEAEDTLGYAPRTDGVLGRQGVLQDVLAVRTAPAGHCLTAGDAGAVWRAPTPWVQPPGRHRALSDCLDAAGGTMWQAPMICVAR
jgi:hypothetical protein